MRYLWARDRHRCDDFVRGICCHFLAQRVEVNIKAQHRTGICMASGLRDRDHRHIPVVHQGRREKTQWGNRARGDVVIYRVSLTRGDVLFQVLIAIMRARTTIHAQCEANALTGTPSIDRLPSHSYIERWS